MIFDNKRDDVCIGGAESVGEFRIKASARAFQILSSNLYSNPLGSMIRELSTNAYDAHVESGKSDIPFSLTLPNSLEPTFKVRDFGPGLCEADINHVYTTFFESTKTNSNDVVGCLGLGSKSPFGVSDSFTITSYQGGKKTIYSAFLNDERIPSIAKFGVFDTDEQDGLEIEVAIRKDDFHIFSREVNHQLKYFNVKPQVYGNSSFKWDMNEEYLYEGTKWKMVKNGNTIRVIQGQIQYPISVNDMGKYYESASDIVKSILNSPMLFEVNIGDVNIAPSREALSYDEKTSRNIISAAERIAVELPKIISQAIKNAETEYEAKLLCYDIMNSLNYSSRYGYNSKSLRQVIMTNKQILWNGKNVANTDIMVDCDIITSITGFNSTWNKRFNKIKYSLYSFLDNGIEKKHWNLVATPLSRTMWVYSTENDTAVESRAKQYFKNNYGNNSTTSCMFIITSNKPAADVAAALGLRENQLVIAADLPKVKRILSGKKKDNTIDVPLFVVNREVYKTSSKTKLWPTNYISDLSLLTGYYVDLNRFDVELPDNFKLCKCKGFNFESFIEGAIELGFITSKDNIYGLRSTARKKHHNFINLFDHIEANKHIIKTKKIYDFGNSNIISMMINNIHDAKRISALIEDKDSPFITLLNAVLNNRTSQYTNKTTKFLEVMNIKDELIDVREEATNIDLRYSMISLIHYSYNPDIVATYINQMDTLWKLQKQTENNQDK